MSLKQLGQLDLYGEHMPEERITGSKIDLDLSAGSTYTRVYMVPLSIMQTFFGQYIDVYDDPKSVNFI